MKTWIVVEEARGNAACIATTCTREGCRSYHAWLDVADRKKAAEIVDALNAQADAVPL